MSRGSALAGRARRRTHFNNLMREPGEEEKCAGNAAVARRCLFPTSPFPATGLLLCCCSCCWFLEPSRARCSVLPLVSKMLSCVGRKRMETRGLVLISCVRACAWPCVGAARAPHRSGYDLDAPWHLSLCCVSFGPFRIRFQLVFSWFPATASSPLSERERVPLCGYVVCVIECLVVPPRRLWPVGNRARWNPHPGMSFLVFLCVCLFRSTSPGLSRSRCRPLRNWMGFAVV